MFNWAKRAFDRVMGKAPAVVPPQLTNQLHPEFAKRLGFVMQDLKDRGWQPMIGLSSGYRTTQDQLRAKRAGGSDVSFGFHNVTGPGGGPLSMAVHIIDRNLGFKIPIDHQIWKDINTSSQRHGLRTGYDWHRDAIGKLKKGKPFEGHHVQLYDNSSLKAVRKWVARGSRGAPPHYAKPRMTLWSPQLGLRPSVIPPPRSLQDLSVAGRFQLHARVGSSLRGHPSLGSFQLRQPTIRK